MSNELKSLKNPKSSDTYKQKEKSDISLSEPNIPEKKKYINLYICELSVGIIFTYIFISCSITINIVNRVIFWKYKFKFNFTLVLLQQFFCMIFYYICSKKSELFIEQTGGVSFEDFWKLKYQYIGYCIFFIVKTVTSFLGYQLVTNIPMYVNLRKFLTAMTFIYQYFCKKKKISNINILVVILLTLGALLTGIDDYSTENFKKKNGMTNLKLLVYNSFLSTPLLLIYIFINGEFFRLIDYFNEEHDFNYLYLLFFLFISCSIVMVTNASFFISNEKNTSLFTQLVSDTKYIIITLISYNVLQSFVFTWKNIFGLLLSTLAAIIITINSLYNNIKFNKGKHNNTNENSGDNPKENTKFEEVNIEE